MLEVQFNLDSDTLPVDEAMYKRLIGSLFAKQPEVELVVLTNLPGGSAGLSSLAILLAHPIGAQASQRNPLLIRIGPEDAINEEQRRYEVFVKPYIGLHHAQRHAEPAVDPATGMAAIAYDYLHDPKSDQPLQTLSRYLGERDNVDAVARAVNKLFLETLAPGQRRNGWYNDGHVYENQRPLWFYNTMLHPTVTLSDVTLVTDEPAADIALADQLALADSPACAALQDQRVYLRTTTAYPHLRVVERESGSAQDRIRLYLYEYAIVPSTVYQPPQAVAARIDLIVASGSFADLKPGINLDDCTLQGRVLTTRFAALDDLRRHHLGLLPKQTDILLQNPLLRYHSLLSRPRALTIATNHGDLNLSNVLLSHLDLGPELTAWLIDFDKTGPGAHAVFDAVKLETEYKMHILPYHLRSVDEFIQLERALHQALIDPEKAISWNKNNIALRDAYQFIATIRRTILCDLSKTRIPPVEYYLGLLGYGLAALKYRNLYDIKAMADAHIKPLAVAAYLSASFAASVIDECEDVAVTAESYPPIRLSLGRLLERPQLIARESVLARARLRLQERPPVVVLYGQLGSGRGAIATALCAEFQRSGYSLLTWPSFFDADHITTVDALLAILVPLLHEQKIGKLPLRLSKQHSAIGFDQRIAELKRVQQLLIATLEGSPQPLLLFLQLSDADEELRTFVAQLAAELRRTLLIVVADQPLAALPAETAVEVTPFSLENVQRYVRYEQLPLDEKASTHLFEASHGLPHVLKYIVEQARIDQGQRACSLQDAVLQVPRYQHIGEWARNIVQRQPAPIRHLLEIDALLHEYSADVLAEEDALFTTIIEASGWVAPGTATKLIATYRNQAFRHYSGLSKLLRQQALVQARSHPTFPQLCARIALFYQEQLPADLYLVARYQALAGQWQRAAATLSEMGLKPVHIYTARYGQLYKLVAEVFEHTLLYDEVSLLELTGSCAAYLGYYSDAARYYDRLLAKLPENNKAYPRLLGRLLQVYEAAEDDEQAEQVCQLIFDQVDAADPLYALAYAYKGHARLAEAPAEATPFLQEAITILEQSRARWGAEQPFYEEQRILLYDALAQSEAMQGQAGTAIEHLMKVRPIAWEMQNLALLARIDNNLGFVYYYVRARARDAKFARACFEDALRIRKEIGDRVGQVRTAQNLANLLSDLARGAEDWQEAEKLFQEYEKMIVDSPELAQMPQRELILVNHLDALIDRGAFSQAHALFGEVELAHVRSKNTHTFLLLNRAKLALWEEDAATCAEYLYRTLPINETEGSMNKIEWAQLMFECHLLLGAPLDSLAEQWVATITVDPRERPIDAAKCFHAQGLLATTRAEHSTALQHFEHGRLHFLAAGYYYRAALCALWETRIAVQNDNAAAAKESAKLVKTLLRPFGETPALQRLHRLPVQLSKEV